MILQPSNGPTHDDTANHNHTAHYTQISFHTDSPKPTLSIALKFYNIFSLLTTIIGTLGILLQFLLIIINIKQLCFQPMQLFFYIYGLFFTLILILSENEILVSFRVTISSWTRRGVFYIFISLFIYNNYLALCNNNGYLLNITNFVIYGLLLIGFMYGIMASLISFYIQIQLYLIFSYFALFFCFY